MYNNPRTRWTTGSLAALAALVVLTIGAVGCASTRPPGNQFDDAVLTSKVQTKIAADPGLNPFEIHVDTLNRVVRLSGNVETDVDREAAERLPRGTEGVVDVRNDIGLGDPTLGENVTDAWIVTKIKAKLTADPQINPFNIDVDASEGRVTLSGTVAKQEARDEAERHARDTKGVKSVTNLITVKTG